MRSKGLVLSFLFFDGEYEIVDGLPESEDCKRFEVKFKVVLEVDKLYSMMFFYNYFKIVLTSKIEGNIM